METTKRQARPAALPWGLVGMIGMVAAVEAFAVRRDETLTSYQGNAWRFAARQLEDPGKSAEVLCLGDSLTKFGVIPQVLERATGKKSFNLALPNGPAPASYVMFRRVLERKGRPSVVLIDFDSDILAEGPRSARRPTRGPISWPCSNWPNCPGADATPTCLCA
jgi:hypothetical protein